MGIETTRSRVWVSTTFIALAAFGTEPAAAQWPQWGGPNRDFTVETSGLADTWPEDGPARLWHRELGDGYSAIVYDDGLLYTMYRKARMDKEAGFWRRVVLTCA